MSVPAGLIDDYFHSREMAFHRPDPTTWLVKVAGSGDHSWYLQVTTVEEHDQLLVYSDMPVEVPPPRRPGLAVWAARANRGLPVGNFEVDLDTGDVWCKTSLDHEGDELSDALLDNLLFTNFSLVDRYLDPLLRWVAGEIDGPERAVMVAEDFLDG